MKTGFVYDTGSKSGTIYVGVTSNLERRVWEHKNHGYEGFTKKYRVTRLLYVEDYSRIDDAIARDEQIKGWSRGKKLALVRAQNPLWNDLEWNWFGD